MYSIVVGGLGHAAARLAAGSWNYCSCSGLLIFDKLKMEKKMYGLCKL